MPPAFILSQDQTLHYKKFDSPDTRLGSGFSFQFGGTFDYFIEGLIILINRIILRCSVSKELFLLTRFFGQLHYFSTAFSFCKQSGGSFLTFFQTPAFPAVPKERRRCLFLGNSITLASLSVFASTFKLFLHNSLCCNLFQFCTLFHSKGHNGSPFLGNSITLARIWEFASFLEPSRTIYRQPQEKAKEAECLHLRPDS